MRGRVSLESLSKCIIIAQIAEMEGLDKRNSSIRQLIIRVFRSILVTLYRNCWSNSSGSGGRIHRNTKLPNNSFIYSCIFSFRTFLSPISFHLWQTAFFKFPTTTTGAWSISPGYFLAFCYIKRRFSF